MKPSDLLLELDQSAEELLVLEPGDGEAAAALYARLIQLSQAFGDGGFEPLQRVVAQSARALLPFFEGAMPAQARAVADEGRARSALETASRALAKATTLAQQAALEPAPRVPTPRNTEDGSSPGHDLDAEVEEAWPRSASSNTFTDRALLEAFLSETEENLQNGERLLMQLEARHDDDDCIRSLFRVVHTLKGNAGFLELDLMSAACHAFEERLDAARGGHAVLSDAEIQVAFDLIDALRALCVALAAGAGREAAEKSTPLAQVRQRIEDLQANSHAQSAVATPSDEDRSSGPLTEPAKESHWTQGELEAGAVLKAREYIKVDAAQLDRLLDAIGELVVTQSRVKATVDLLHLERNGELASQLVQLDRVSRELQSLGTELRMVPLSALFRKLARVVRNLARRAGKVVELHVEGEDTEIDKGVVDRLTEPLTHLLRNAVDHGLEEAEARRSQGKPPVGGIWLRACHRGGNVIIEVEDDGRGLDTASIAAKAVELGIADTDAAIGRAADLMFEPGLTTARRVTDVSGRGVGLDVVKRATEELRAEIQVDTEQGRGTLFAIRLPQTLAIIDGIVVRVGGERYVVPTVAVLRSVQPTPSACGTLLDKDEALLLDGELIPLLRLERIFDVAGAQHRPEQGIVVVIDSAQQRYGLLADEVLGQQQVVIKSMGGLFGRSPGISGATVLPDGQVGLIIEPAGLARAASWRGRTQSAPGRGATARFMTEGH